jgi:superfamily II DNA or RNA helicase
MKTLPLRFEATCADCGARLPVGAVARYYGRGIAYGVACHSRSSAESPPATLPAVERNVHNELRFRYALYGWQRKAGSAWTSNDRMGIVEAVTGAGKTVVGLAAIYRALERERRVAVIVPTRELLYQWYERISEAFGNSVDCGLRGDGNSDDLQSHRVVVSIVNSARDGLGLEGDGLLIADECHRYGSRENRRALDKAFVERLGLSATHERSDGAHSSTTEPYFSGVVYRLGYAEAIKEGVVAKFRVGLLPAALSDQERQSYEELSSQVTDAWKRLVNKLGVPAEPYADFMKQVREMQVNGAKSARIAADAYWSSIQQRRKLLAEIPAKLASLDKLQDAIRASHGAIIFTETINSADKVAARLSASGIATLAYHSELDSKERKARLEKFKRRQIVAVSAPRALDEGIDVPEADLAIIVAASRERRQMIQRMGRVLRPKQDGRVAQFVICFAENTIEDPAKKESRQFFVDEVTTVAEDVHQFRADCGPKEVYRFLSTGHRD